MLYNLIMDFKIHRFMGKAILPIVTIVILSGPIYIEDINKALHWKKLTFDHTHKHTETRQYILPKLNIIVSGITIAFTTSTFTTAFILG